jgi:excisionase family DNA binding protein
VEAKINIDTQELVKEIIGALKPLLTGGQGEDVIFTCESLAKYLEVSKQWVYERVSLKEIPYSKMGHFPRFKKSEIDKWLDSLKVPALNPLSRKLKAIK